MKIITKLLVPSRWKETKLKVKTFMNLVSKSNSMMLLVSESQLKLCMPTPDLLKVTKKMFPTSNSQLTTMTAGLDSMLRETLVHAPVLKSPEMLKKKVHKAQTL